MHMYASVYAHVCERARTYTQTRTYTRVHTQKVKNKQIIQSTPTLIICYRILNEINLNIVNKLIVKYF